MRARAAGAFVRLAGVLNPERRNEFSAELHALQGVERISGFDYALGTLVSAASERAVAEIRRTLVIASVSKTYGTTTVLSNVTLRVHPGEVVALMGANGAGKTTLLRMLAGEETVHRGKITFGNTTVGAEVPAALRPRGASNLRGRRLPPGLVVIRPTEGLIDHFSVAENIAFGSSRGWLVKRSAERAQACAALQQVWARIDPDRLAQDLSPAERIQVLLAREAANGSAELVVLDEPTAAMSTSESEVVFNSIAAARAKGLGVILVSHRIDQILRVADRVVVLVDGRLVLDEAVSRTGAGEVLEAINGVVAAYRRPIAAEPALSNR